MVTDIDHWGEPLDCRRFQKAPERFAGAEMRLGEVKRSIFCRYSRKTPLMFRSVRYSCRTASLIEVEIRISARNIECK
jgi:hypothetical protein